MPPQIGVVAMIVATQEAFDAAVAAGATDIHVGDTGGAVVMVTVARVTARAGADTRHK